MNLKKLIALALVLTMANSAWAALNTVTYTTTANGLITSQTSTSNNITGTSYYDALGRFSYSKDENGVVQARMLYGSGTSVYLQRTDAGNFVAQFTTSGGQLVTDVTVNGDMSAVNDLNGLKEMSGVTVENIASAYATFNAQNFNGDHHNIASFSQILAMTAGKYTTANGVRTLDTDFVGKVMVASAQSSLLADFSDIEMARFLGFQSGATGNVTINGNTYSNIGNGSGGNGNTEIGGMVSEISAFAKAATNAGAGDISVSFSGDASGARVKADATPPIGVQFAAGGTTYGVKDADGKAQAFSSTCGNIESGTYSYDPLVQGRALGIQVVNGANYVRVQANSVDMFDGQGFQSADGEEIWVQVDDATAADIQAGISSGNNQIVIAGNVTADVSGHLTMTMNEGGYAAGSDAQQVTDNWLSAHDGFYNDMVNNMSNVWASAKVQGAGSDWKSGWSFLRAAVTNGSVVSPTF